MILILKQSPDENGTTLNVCSVNLDKSQKKMKAD